MVAKTKIKQSFSAASLSYDSVAFLQRKVGKLLLQQIDFIGQIDTLLDLGCGTGFLIDEFMRQNSYTPKQVLALDIAESMLHIARSKLENNSSVTYLCADAETLPLKPDSVDIVISNLALQWCRDLEKAFSDVKRILKLEGRFIFTTFGSSTLKELKNAWKDVDDYAHVNTFQSVAQITELLRGAGFNVVEVEARTYISTYESVWDLMAELKQLGAQTVMAGQNKQITSKAAMNRMIYAYQRLSENGLISATFEVIMVEARL